MRCPLKHYNTVRPLVESTIIRAGSCAPPRRQFHRLSEHMNIQLTYYNYTHMNHCRRCQSIYFHANYCLAPPLCFPFTLGIFCYSNVFCFFNFFIKSNARNTPQICHIYVCVCECDACGKCSAISTVRMRHHTASS